MKSTTTDEFEKGQWHAFNRVLHLINTYDTKMVDKGQLYDDVMDMRPIKHEDRNSQ